jgi:hypothetical protein
MDSLGGAQRFVNSPKGRDTLLAGFKSCSDNPLKYIRALFSIQLPQAKLQGNDRISKVMHLASGWWTNTYQDALVVRAWQVLPSLARTCGLRHGLAPSAAKRGMPLQIKNTSMGLSPSRVHILMAKLPNLHKEYPLSSEGWRPIGEPVKIDLFSAC